jgi:hypothetical protein
MAGTESPVGSGQRRRVVLESEAAGGLDRERDVNRRIVSPGERLGGGRPYDDGHELRVVLLAAEVHARAAPDRVGERSGVMLAAVYLLCARPDCTSLSSHPQRSLARARPHP